MKTILFIDDDADEFLIFSEVLEMSALPLKCVYLSDPSTALIWLYHNEAEFIFIDMVMPKINGVELMQKLKEIPQSLNSKFILLSTYIDDRLLEKAILAGATTCMQKADTIKAMSTRIKDFFAGYQL